MRKRLWSTRRRKIAAVTVLALVLVSSAFAGWMVVGNRSGTTARTSSLPIAPVVSPSATPTANLSPGNSVGLQVDIQNPNSYALTLTEISATNFDPNMKTVSGGAGCLASNFTASWSSPTGLAIPIPAGGPTKVTLPGQSLSMALLAPPTCADRTVTVSDNGGTSGFDLTFTGP